RGNRENFAIHGSGADASSANRSPCTSWTMRPPWRSIDGMSIRVVPGCRELAVEAGARAVAIHGRQEDLAGAARFRLLCPFDRVPRGVGGTAAHEHGE